MPSAYLLVRDDWNSLPYTLPQLVGLANTSSRDALVNSDRNGTLRPTTPPLPTNLPRSMDVSPNALKYLSTTSMRGADISSTSLSTRPPLPLMGVTACVTCWRYACPLI